MAQLLPQELIVEILLCLPVKSLKRFRSLSKELCGVIDSPNFINWHLNRSSQNFNLRKMIFPDRSREKFHVCGVNFDLLDEVEGEILPLVVQQVSTFWREVCGNCNGLLLLYRTLSYPFGFALWNPSTGQYRDLPDCPFEITANVYFHMMNRSGLGYDDSTDDYKAIISVYMEQRDIREVEQFWIYSLKSNNWTRAPNFPYYSNTFFSNGIGYFTDGSLHWIGRLRIDNQYVDSSEEIVAFDVREETFSLVPPPVICSTNSEVIISSKLHVLEGHLCISYLYSSQTPRVDLFIRKKDVVDQFGWTNLFSLTEPLSLDIYNLKVLGYSKGGDKILLALDCTNIYDILDDCKTYIYDLKEKSLRKVEIEKKNPNWNAPIVCLESLVSVGGGGA